VYCSVHIGIVNDEAGRIGTGPETEGAATMSPKSAKGTLNTQVKTLPEVACVLRISRGSAYEAAKRGEIPTIRIGRRLLVPTDALEKLLSGDRSK